ncbi:SAF domain-containing protein [Paenibacillus faecalis]|uniref:SAF domain-containing protein n=1 Tax=Paenibacillus faecalis TaxID=2079532 RepID=UPI000D107209|nr:SAF domain-containing protein [Paenibacillus faecalis]
MPIITRRSKKMLYAGLVGAGCMGIVLAGGFYYIQSDNANRHADETKRYQQRINELETAQIGDMKSMKSAWVPLRDIPAGHFIDSQDLQEVRLPLEASPDNLPARKEDVMGKGAKIELRKGTPITLGMLFEEEATPRDLRNREMKSVWLPSNLKQDDVVDIRIQFPTGQDYIVLSKKRIDKLASPAFWTTLNEQEILLYSSAMVDAYIHQASIYALTYVEPELQEKAIPNYPPNEEVIRLIKNDPNIVRRAEQQLESSIRKALDRDLGKVKAGGQQFAGQYGSSNGQGAQDFNTWTTGNPAEDHADDSSASSPNTASVETYDGERNNRLEEAQSILEGHGQADGNPQRNEEEMEAVFTEP